MLTRFTLNSDGYGWTDNLTGRVIPVVAGGSDEGDPGPAPIPDPAPAPDPAPSPDPAPTPAPAPDPNADPFDDPATENFPRPYVERLRREAAERRTALEPYKTTFDGWEPEAVDSFLDLGRQLATDPESAVRRMLDISRQIAGDEFDNLLNSEPNPEYMTPAQVEEYISKREAKQAQEREAAANAEAVRNEAKDLGYEDNTPEYAELFWRAYHNHEGDLKAAHEAIQARNQKIIDDHIAKIQGRNAGFPAVPSHGNGPADPTGGPPRSFASAREAAEARFAAQAGEPA